ncbi:nucleoside hydrolase [Nocardiopsis sp. CNT-189]|uniref:nucleoside hydrolase n=1 Tax=Nocardiopsis oceanisediminis TaxID=2816862 RepID=UPI003B2A70EE
MSDEDPGGAAELERHPRNLIDLGEALPGTGLEATAEALRQSGPWPEDLRNTPLILDTDIGGDPDDAIAVAAAARRAPELALLITTDEIAGDHRARFARHLLDTLGLPELPVAAGADLGNTRYHCVQGLTPDSVPAQTLDPIAAIREIAARSSGPIRWAGMGPMTNLARLCQQAPELLPRLRLTQMGGALRYRDPRQAEHNLRLDPEAVRTVLGHTAEGRLATPELITSEITFVPDTEITADHPLYRALASPGAPEWAGLLVAGMDRWFERFFPATKQHDALALSAALELPFVDSDPMELELDAIGRTTASEKGTRVRVSTSAHYPGFMAWLHDTLDPAASPAGGARAREERGVTAADARGAGRSAVPRIQEEA